VWVIPVPALAALYPVLPMKIKVERNCRKRKIINSEKRNRIITINPRNLHGGR
jgi:hypothetical protein